MIEIINHEKIRNMANRMDSFVGKWGEETIEKTWINGIECAKVFGETVTLGELSALIYACLDSFELDYRIVDGEVVIFKNSKVQTEAKNDDDDDSNLSPASLEKRLSFETMLKSNPKFLMFQKAKNIIYATSKAFNGVNGSNLQWRINELEYNHTAKFFSYDNGLLYLCGGALTSKHSFTSIVTYLEDSLEKTLEKKYKDDDGNFSGERLCGLGCNRCTNLIQNIETSAEYARNFPRKLDELWDLNKSEKLIHLEETKINKVLLPYLIIYKLSQDATEHYKDYYVTLLKASIVKPYIVGSALFLPEVRERTPEQMLNYVIGEFESLVKTVL